MSQLDAFDPIPYFPRARTTDARSSHEAAAAVEKSGLAKAQAQRVLAGIRRHPGSTSMELSRAARIERYAVARRLPELAEVGLVEKILPTDATAPCSVSGKRAIRWRPV